jgi:eukaryotic translation initiation factor 2C
MEICRIDDGKGNCKAGVAVDSGITQPWIENFYLQTHAAIQGSKHSLQFSGFGDLPTMSASRSAHYIVLEDEVFQRFGSQQLEA